MASDMSAPEAGDADGPAGPPGFDALAAAYLDEMFADNPAYATFHGWDGHDDRSPDLTAAAIVGALAEAMLGPLARRDTDADSLTAGLQSFVLSAVGAESHVAEPVV